MQFKWGSWIKNQTYVSNHMLKDKIIAYLDPISEGF